MKNSFLKPLLFLLFASAFAAAQFTTVTGTVTDPNGLPYAFGTIAPTIVASGTPKFSSTGTLYLPPVQASGLDSKGKFIVTLADNTQLTPGSSTWNFTVCSGIGSVLPDFGNGPICFTVTGITISGSSQDIGSTLRAAAPALTANFSAGGGTVTGSGTNGTFAGWTGTSALGNAPCTFTATGMQCTQTATGSFPGNSLVSLFGGSNPNFPWTIQGPSGAGIFEFSQYGSPTSIGRGHGLNFLTNLGGSPPADEGYYFWGVNAWLTLTATTTIFGNQAPVNATAGLQQNGTALGISCGTTTSCANTAAPLAHFVYGQVNLSSGTPSTAVVTGISPAFTSTTSFSCSADNNTAQADNVKVANTSTSSITITGPNTVTDLVSYVCIGT